MKRKQGRNCRALVLGVAAVVCVALAADGDTKAGQKVFASKCAKCHDADTKVYKTGPGLKGVKDGELPSGDPTSAEAILTVIEDGREEMPPIGNELSEQEKKDVIAYVLTL